MTIKEYSDKAIATAIYGESDAIIYPTLGINGEAGEIAEKVKKILRDKKGVFDQENKLELLKEAGDVLWYINALCRDLGFTLELAAQLNIEKLESRRRRDVLGGSGDNR